MSVSRIGFAVVPGLRDRDRFQVLLDAVGDLVEDHRALGRGGLAQAGAAAWAASSALSMSASLGLRHLAENLTGHGVVLEVRCPCTGGTPAPPM